MKLRDSFPLPFLLLFLTFFLLLFLTFFMTGPTHAEVHPRLLAQFGTQVNKLKLTNAQQRNLLALMDTNAQKLSAAQEKLFGALSEEQQEILKRSYVQITRAGTSPANIPKRLQEAIGTFELSGENKQEVQAAMKTYVSILAAMGKDSRKFLSDKQASKLFPSGAGKKKK